MMDERKLKEILQAHVLYASTDGRRGMRANLRGADLRWANLSGADLRWADIDFSCWPLWCGSRRVKVDQRIAAQLAAHFCVLDCADPAYMKARKAVLNFAKKSHRAADLVD